MMITLLYYYIYTMKNSVKAFAFVAAALGLTVLSLQGTNAQNATVDLIINSGAISCSNGNFNLGSTATSLSTQTLNTNSTTFWLCTDLNGTNNNAVQVTIATTGQITNGVNTIASSDSLIQTTNEFDDCAGGVAFQSSQAALSGTVDLMKKQTASSICTYSSIPNLEVTIPAQASPGAYSGIITVTFPS